MLSSPWFLGGETIICYVSKTCRNRPKLRCRIAGRNSRASCETGLWKNEECWRLAGHLAAPTRGSPLQHLVCRSLAAARADVRIPTSLRGRALPAQRPDFRSRTGLPPQDLVNIRARYDRLAPWMAGDVWARYEWAREVYALTHRDWHRMERGFDYALTHHQLNMRHTLRKATAPDPLPIGDGEPGEKCTLCGKRTALGGEVLAGGLESARFACASMPPSPAHRRSLAGMPWQVVPAAPIESTSRPAVPGGAPWRVAIATNVLPLCVC